MKHTIDTEGIKRKYQELGITINDEALETLITRIDAPVKFNSTWLMLRWIDVLEESDYQLPETRIIVVKVRNQFRIYDENSLECDRKINELRVNQNMVSDAEFNLTQLSLTAAGFLVSLEDIIKLFAQVRKKYQEVVEKKQNKPGGGEGACPHGQEG